MARRIISAIPGQEWAALLTGFTRSAFRLEGFQHYSAPDEIEALARFRADEDPRIDLTWWTDLARKHTQAGRTMSRVRVIVEPPSEYTRFELVAYPVMAAAGDDIRVISVDPGRWPADVPHHDYWLFDDRDVWGAQLRPGGSFAQRRTPRRRPGRARPPALARRRACAGHPHRRLSSGHCPQSIVTA
jgi:hypothetical protein